MGSLSLRSRLHRIRSVALSRQRRTSAVFGDTISRGRDNPAGSAASMCTQQRSGTQESWDNASLGATMLGIAVAAVGLSYASVPLYRIFCQATGFGGTVKTHKGVSGEEGYDLPADPSKLAGNRPLKITFNSDVPGDLNWSFRPVQKSITVLAGQTALAFFRGNKSLERARHRCCDVQCRSNAG